MPLVSRISTRPIRQSYCENALDEHGDVHSCDSDLLEDVHCIACQWRIHRPLKNGNLLGMMGSRAPFHSHRQNIATTAAPEHSGARTTGEDHGNVTPP